MGSEDKQPFKEAMEAMFAAFDREATKASFMGYWMGLQDMELRSVQAAVALAMRRCKFLPKPAELRELVEGPPETQAELAWNDVLKATALGPYKHIDFADKCINAVIRGLGGWPSFLSRFTDAESEKWARIDFMKSYGRMQGRLSSEATAYLPGITELPVAPCIVGNPNRLAITQSSQARIGWEA